jgi:hypothetical protein
MSNTLLAKTGATLFILWGLLHIAGGLTLLLTGFEAYGQPASAFPPVAIAVLQYLAFLLLAIAIAVIYCGVRLNWRNHPLGLAINTLLVGVADLGLAGFLVLPGFVSWLEASPGLVLFALALTTATLACRSTHASSELPQ